MITCCDCVSWVSISVVTWNSPSPVERPNALDALRPVDRVPQRQHARSPGATAPGRFFGMYCDDGIHGRK